MSSTGTGGLRAAIDSTNHNFVLFWEAEFPNNVARVSRPVWDVALARIKLVGGGSYALPHLYDVLAVNLGDHQNVMTTLANYEAWKQAVRAGGFDELPVGEAL
ncbi:hypothetical protein [Planotetraspora silvatica]|uniref:hypothetical protein n=1 Tax=Planotetraspora silvatica TaxID=234614 RepID=UPI0031CFDA4A